MDILNLITKKDLIGFSENYKYTGNNVISRLFTDVKTNNLKLRIRQLVENGELPSVAQYHAYDTEARIGSRTNFKELDFEKLLIKEKINQTERIAEVLGENASEDAMIDFIYDDMANVSNSVYTRTLLAEAQLISTGEININENDFIKNVSFGYKTSHNKGFTGWDNPKHDILADIEAMKTLASKEGKVLTRAITSSTIVNYIVNNEKVIEKFSRTDKLPTSKNVLGFIYDNFGISFQIDDDLYKKTKNDTESHRFYPENKISFFTGEGTLGENLFGITPEERKLTDRMTKGLVTLHQWNTDDPVATWTKASAMNLPVMKDIDSLFIATITKEAVGG